MLRVLIVDDEPQMRRMLRESLERAGYAVDEACDGLHALARFAENRPDLVITDMIMPQREGVETIQALRAKCPALPIIAISGGGMRDPKDYLVIATAMGASRVFAKPFRVDEVLTAIAEITKAAVP